jgi:site-specific DNA-methyltransferase (adenine-specific)
LSYVKKISHINKIINCDVREGLKKLPNNIIDCCITSPPYWQKRDYDVRSIIWDEDIKCEHDFLTNKTFCSKCSAWKGCLGLEPTFYLYVKHLCDIFDEIKRVLRSTGTCWVNIGDTHASKTKGKSIDVPDKCLCMIPQRFALEMINRGWILRNVIIWKKPNAHPSSTKDRFTVNFEYVYFFSKQQQYFFDQDAVRVPNLDISKRRAMRGTSGSHKYLKHNPSPNGVDGQCMIKEREYIGYKDMDKKISDGKTYLNPKGRNRRCVWEIPNKQIKEVHFATFPNKLVEPMIKAGCPINGIVLDPFAGIGTTLIQSKKLRRNFIGYEISKKYCLIAIKNIKKIIPINTNKFC